MKGLELSEQYFTLYGAPMIEAKFPDYKDRIAAGLVGKGSDCYGFDDELSKDHDWGPGFCLWLNSEDYRKIGAVLQAEVDKLPKEFAGISRKISAPGGIGVFEIGSFYKDFIGIDKPPSTLQEWRWIPETDLAECTNGKVFTDALGEFSDFRKKLLAFYPEDIRLNKIARRCMCAGQSGQYNFRRAVKREEYVTAHYVEAMFIEDAIALVFLFNRKYMPYFKWMHRALKNLPILGSTVYELLNELVIPLQHYSGESVYKKKRECIKAVCSYLIEELRVQHLSDSDSDSLMRHGPIVQSKIENKEIRDLGAWAR